MSKYLYGASVQGIQGFIFETNRLKEIVGASDLVEEFCSLVFLAKFANEYEIKIPKNAVLRNAGGNIRIAFDNEEDVKKMVKHFPQYVMQQAYGITLSQSVIEFNESDNYIKKKDELEYKLTKARNQASIPLDSRFSLMLQTPRTGKASFESKKYKDENKIEYFDKGNWQKDSDAENGRENILLTKLNLQEVFEKFPLEMESISNDNNKVAIIHADGNKMGLMLQQMNKDLKDKETEEIQKIFKDFSTQITNSTNSAVQEAFEKNFNKDDEKIQFRPIVIGGDDVTVICNPNNALEFTRDYLIAFEKHTKKNFLEHDLSQYAEKLTACAGISFCNHKFPFHYAYSLADKLCTYAKEKSDREASCLAFHNIQSSYFTSYDDYVKDELTIRYQEEKEEDILLQFAPYYVEEREDKPTIDALQEVFYLFNDADIPFGKYRAWLTELNKSREYAELFLERVDAVMRMKLEKHKYNRLDEALGGLNTELKLNRLISSKDATPMADIMQLKSVLGGK